MITRARDHHRIDCPVSCGQSSANKRVHGGPRTVRDHKDSGIRVGKRLDVRVGQKY